MHFSAADILLEPVDNRRLSDLCGPLNKHLRQLETRLGVEINNFGNVFRVTGTKKSIGAAERLLQLLYKLTENESLSPEAIHLHIHALNGDHAANDEEPGEETAAVIKTKRGVIKGRSPNQRGYLKNIDKYDLSFGIGPAGSGKTYLAVACAVAALERERVRRIVLVRPAVEAGENLGFLPGDLSQKVDPYLRPIYDALYEMVGFDRASRYIGNNIIEVAPLAFMRGRTLNDSFIILDEAQNTTVDQMKMFLTRIGFGSKAVVTGDITQTDLPQGRRSGLRQVIDVLKDEDGVSFTFFNAGDIVRHSLVARILNAYEKHERDEQG